MIKHFCRLVTESELADEDVAEFYDVVTSIMPAKVVQAYTEDGESVVVEVTQYVNADSEFVYEIVLGDQVDESEGDDVTNELTDVFDFDFEFEASVEL